MSNYKKYKDGFVNYAHRGASEYLPENTLLSFYTGIYMGANGIETDIRRAKDGILVLFHDRSLERVTGDTRIIEEVTPELEAELLALGATEICPCATLMTANDVERWHNMGFRVRAWGVKNEDVMKYAYDAGVDGMTVNFPDKLEEYRK